MLVNKPLQEGDIVALKLVNGEEVIGKLTNLTADRIELSKPISIGMAQQGLALMPFMLSADEGVEVTIDRDNVITEILARKEVKDVYIQQTSGLVTAGQLPEGLNQNNG